MNALITTSIWFNSQIILKIILKLVTAMYVYVACFLIRLTKHHSPSLWNYCVLVKFRSCCSKLICQLNFLFKPTTGSDLSVTHGGRGPASC